MRSRVASPTRAMNSGISGQRHGDDDGRNPVARDNDREDHHRDDHREEDLRQVEREVAVEDVDSPRREGRERAPPVPPASCRRRARRRGPVVPPAAGTSHAPRTARRRAPPPTRRLRGRATTSASSASGPRSAPRPCRRSNAPATTLASSQARAMMSTPASVPSPIEVNRKARVARAYRSNLGSSALTLFSMNDWPPARSRRSAYTTESSARGATLVIRIGDGSSPFVFCDAVARTTGATTRRHSRWREAMTRAAARARHEQGGRRVRLIWHHGRSREGDDLPLALPARAPRAAQLPDPRRRGRRLDGGATHRPRALIDHRHRGDAR